MVKTSPATAYLHFETSRRHTLPFPTPKKTTLLRPKSLNGTSVRATVTIEADMVLCDFNAKGKLQGIELLGSPKICVPGQLSPEKTPR